MKRGCPTPIKGCKYLTSGGCFADDHHLYFPKSWYRTKIEQEFRELFVANICRRIHDEIHAVTQPPPKPSRKEMKEAIDRLG